MWEIRYVDRVTREIIVVKRVTSFALANTIAKELPHAIGKHIVVSKYHAGPQRFDIWLWVIESKTWIRMKGRPVTKRDSLRFHARFDSREAVAVHWPVGVELPTANR